MYSELFKKDNNSILKYLQKLGENKKIYSECRHGIGPLFPDADFYIYATEEEIAIVLIDQGSPERYDVKDEIVWDLATTCQLYRERFLRLSKHVPHIFGVLVSAEDAMAIDEMQEIWEAVEVSVIEHVDDLEDLHLPVNTDSELSIAFPLVFLYEAEFTEEECLEAECDLFSLIAPGESEDETKEKRLEKFAAIMEEHPEMFYDTTELDDLDGEETQKTLEEWLEEIQ